MSSTVSSSSSEQASERHGWRNTSTGTHSAHDAANMGSTLFSLAHQVLSHMAPPPANNMPPNRDHLSENSPLLRPHQHSADSDDESDPHIYRTPRQPNLKNRTIIWSTLTLIFIFALVFVLCFQHLLSDAALPWVGTLPRDPMLAAFAILKVAPVIDGHIDLPILIRTKYANNVTAVPLQSRTPGHVDIPRLRQGRVGGFFWSVYVTCPENQKEDKDDFTEASWRVRDTLEQIDVARSLISKYPDTFQLAVSSDAVVSSITNGKIASLLGVEGGHQLGNSIAVLRQYHALGVRYVTLTHTCHNAFADSSGNPVPLHNGLSPFGRRLIDEMNRLGVLVDLSHTSDETAIQALNHSKAPVIWSHSSARAIHDVPRNVPDDILRLVGKGEGQKDGVVMVNFAPGFIAKPGNASVQAVADHVEHIARTAGRDHVGLGSDFDGIPGAPEGLEDVSKYPALVAELVRRGWNKYEVAGLTGSNVLRVLRGAEHVAKELQDAGTEPIYDLYKARRDIPRGSGI